MKQQLGFAGIVFFYFFGLTVSMAQSLSREVYATSGGYQVGGGVSLSWNMGETVVVTMQSTGNVLSQGFEQSEMRITTGEIATVTFCPGSSFSIPYQASGISDPTNTFTAQLSDATGNFSFPVVLGALTSHTSGIIAATIPIDVPAGDHYRIRVVSDKPQCIGSINNMDIIITPISTWYLDADGDHYYFGLPVTQCEIPGYGYTNSGIVGGDDCNDANAAIYPGATDICNALDDNCDYVIDENAISAVITPAGEVSICNGKTIVLTANTGDGIVYQWKRNGVSIVGATGHSYAAKKSGSYTVEETNVYACSSVSNLVSVVVVPSPSAVINAVGSLNICDTGSVTLQANSGEGYTYKWFKNNIVIAGAVNDSYTTNITGNYSARITNANGCSKLSNQLQVTNSCRTVNPISPTEFTVYPNPNNGDFMLSLVDENRSTTEAAITITDILGQIVYTHSLMMIDGQLGLELKLQNLVAPGLYMVKVIIDKEIFTKQVEIGIH